MGSLSLNTLRSVATQVAKMFRQQEDACREVTSSLQVLASVDDFDDTTVSTKIDGDEVTVINQLASTISNKTFTTVTGWKNLVIDTETSQDNTFISLDSNGDTITALLDKETNELSFNDVLSKNKFFTSLTDSVHELQTNACVQDWLATVADNVRGFTKESIGDLYTTFKAKYKELPGGAETFIGSTIERFKNGGALSFFTTLKDALSNFASSFNQDQTGGFSFTDNTQFLPQNYVAGVIEGILQTASAIISAITMLVSRIAGVIVSLISTIAINIYQNIKRAMTDDSTVSIADANDVTLNAWPFATLQQTRSASVIPTAILNRLNDSASGILGWDVVGGVLLLWHSDFNDVTSDVCIEFHPATNVAKGPFEWWFWTGTSATGYVMPRNTDFTSVASAYYNDSVHDDAIGIASAGDDRCGECYRSLYMANAWFLTAVLSAISGNAGTDDYEFRGWLANHNMPVSAALYPFYDAANDVCNADIFIGTAMYCCDLSESGTVPYSDVTNTVFRIFKLAFPTCTLAQETANTLHRSDMSFAVCAFREDTPWTVIDNDNYVVSIIPFLLAMCEYQSDEGEQRTLNDYVIDVDVAPVYKWTPPKIDFRSTITTIVALGVAAVAVVAITIPVYLKVRKVMRAKQLLARANVEAAYTEAVKNPSQANADAYTKAAKKYNHTFGLISGDKYSYSSYWGDGSQTENSGDAVLQSKLQAIKVLIAGS